MMESKRLWLAGFALIAAAMLVLGLAGCAKEKGKEGEILAKVGGTTIAESDMQSRLADMPPYMKQQLSTPDGRKRLLDGLIEEELMYKDAMAMGLDKSDEYTGDLARAKRDILLRLYYQNVMEAKATPTDKEIEEYYNAHGEEFSIPENLTVRHILVKTRDEALRAKRELDKGARFDGVAAKYSLDASSKANGGLIGGPVQRAGNIKGLGPLPEFNQAAFALKEGEISQPVQSSKGYHIIKVEKYTPATSKSLAEAKVDISSKMASSRRKTVREEAMNQLKAKYKVVYMTETGAKAETPEDLFKMASEASTPQDKIRYYQQFVDKFPKNERAYEAKFMLGFTMAEELKDFDGAEKVFKEFLDKYPETDLSDDAKWMLDNMRSGKHPDLKGD